MFYFIYLQGVPPKKCELLLLLQVVIHTFFLTPCMCITLIYCNNCRGWRRGGHSVPGCQNNHKYNISENIWMLMGLSDLCKLSSTDSHSERMVSVVTVWWLTAGTQIYNCCKYLHFLTFPIFILSQSPAVSSWKTFNGSFSSWSCGKTWNSHHLPENCGCRRLSNLLQKRWSGHWQKQKY